MLVVAHPDDEVLALGGQMASVQPGIFHITTGAKPGDGETLTIRRVELGRALSLAGIPAHQRYASGVPDQSVVDSLPHVYQTLLQTIEDFRPECLLTHPYEGGHPDHDAAALVCSLAAFKGHGLPVYEFTSYHNGTPFGESGTWKTSAFLPPADGAIAIELSAEQVRRKVELLSIFASQRDVLERFPTEHELFRLAPKYRFDQPPHAGMLLYESFDWHLTFGSWLERATKGLRAIQLESEGAVRCQPHPV